MTAATADGVVAEAPGLLVRWLGQGASFRRSLIFITIIGGLWRLGFLIFTKTDRPLDLNDSLYYSIQAGLNAEGRWFEDAMTGQPGAEHGMLTSLYLTPWSIGPSDGVFRQRFALSLLGIATVPVIGLTGRRLSDPLRRTPVGRRGTPERVGLISAAIAAVYPNFWINDSVVMSETIAIFLASVCLLVAMTHHRSLSVRSGIVLGVLAGLAALTRSEMVLYIPGFALLSALLCRRRKRTVWPAVALAAAGVATMLPWTIWNLSRFSEPVFLSTNDGTTLLGANCDLTYHDDIGGWSILCLAPLEPTGPGLPDASERSVDRRGRAFDYIADHVDRVPLVMTARLGRTLDVYGLSSLVDLDVGEEKAEWAVWAGIVCWWVAALLALAGWSILYRRGVGRRWWLTVPLIVVLIATLLLYGAHRIRAPGEPSIVLLAAVALVVWRERMSQAPSRAAEIEVSELAPVP